MYAATSSGVGGNPVKLNVIRRISVRGSASLDGKSLRSFSFARTNLSSSLRLQLSLRSGTEGLWGDLKLHQSSLFVSGSAATLLVTSARSTNASRPNRDIRITAQASTALEISSR